MDIFLWIVTFSLGFSFIFSASETALTSLGKLEAQTLVSEGGWRAKVIQNWVRDPGKILVTILVGNNVVNSASASLFAIWANQRYGSLGVSIAIAAYTSVIIVLCEIVPKLIARRLALRVSPWAMRFLQVVNVLLKPLIWAVHRVSAGFVFLSGIKGRDPRTIISEEELTHTIEMATKGGGIDRATGEALSNLMEFPDRLCRDVMTSRSKIQGIPIRLSLEEVIRFISADGHSRYPVIRDSLDDVVGVLLVKDLLSHMQKGGTSLWTRVVRRPYFVSELAPLGNILRDMRRWGTHLALVRNETGVLTGLVTLEDLIEEIVGEIRDEHDDPIDGSMERAMGGPMLVSGDIPIIDFNDQFGASLPMEVSYSTVNGYLLAKTGGEIPPVGTMIFADDVTFRIHSVSQNGVVTVEIIQQISPHSEN